VTCRAAILARLQGTGEVGPLWLPNLGLWHRFHSSRGTLPTGLEDASQVDVCRAIGAPVFVAVPAYRLELDGADVAVEESGGERVVTARTDRGALVARWTLMPDGEWWQTEYPVKSADDLPAARALVDARRYVLDLSRWSRTQEAVAEDGVVALELPRRPFSEVLHTLLGWSDGLMLLIGDEREAIVEMLGSLEAKLQACVESIAEGPGELAYSPDNLDGSFISPRAFSEHLAQSYSLATRALSDGGKRLLVHVGGPASRLLGPLAAAGVAGVEGVSGPPQGDSPLGEARRLGGPELCLWGGIPQDYIIGESAAGDLERAVAAAVEQSRSDGRVLIGVADQVPTGATLDGLRRIGDLVARTE
jgi:hypothetical protein